MEEKNKAEARTAREAEALVQIAISLKSLDCNSISDMEMSDVRAACCDDLVAVLECDREM